MSLAMSVEQREQFLADLHVGIICIPRKTRGPLAVPIWYDYEPGGEVWMVTGKSSRKGKLLETASRLSLCVQTETPPYKYVSVEGPIVAIEPAHGERHIRPLAHRYLGTRGGDRYMESLEADAGSSILVRMRPERWLTTDYGK